MKAKKAPIGLVRSAAVAATVAFSVATAMPSWAVSIFLTGHDPDFHAFLGGNTAGARKINNVAIDYVMDPAFNTFVAGGINKFLFVESQITPPGGHVNGVNGIIASGYTLGTDFDRIDASGLNAALDQLGTTYSAIVVASDFGGVLTQAELDILNARSGDIIDFLNDGGGLYAMAEGNNGAHLTPNGGWFGYLPFITTSTALNQSEQGFTVTPFGASLGLTNNDINGNASHNIFDGTFGLNIVDVDANGNIMSLAGRNLPTPNSVPEPTSALGLLAFGATSGVLLKRKQQHKA
ncbi:MULTISPECIES: PEP-CTERM sorting domain-containing protein [Aerosakkonema]|uniref:PEP-CTERM sorting domain-containing protein n=1 Tax=Aerosakkonema TaxID=1246629 RepID=UPI0035BA0868